MNDLQTVTKTLSDREKISAIIWIIIGALQIICCVTLIAGGWNIYAGIMSLKRANNVLQPWPGIVKSYEDSLTSMIIGLVINLLFGGVIGVAGSIYDLLAIRDYVLKNRKVFEDAGL